MRVKIETLALAVALSVAVAACGSPEAQQERDTETTLKNEAGVDGTAAAPAQAMSEVQTLAGRIASGELSQGEQAVALEDLDRLISDSALDFPEAIRAKLSEDLASARIALDAEDMNGVQKAALSIQSTLATSDSNGAS